MRVAEEVGPGMFGQPDDVLDSGQGLVEFGEIDSGGEIVDVIADRLVDRALTVIGQFEAGHVGGDEAGQRGSRQTRNQKRQRPLGRGLAVPAPGIGQG